MSDVCVGGGHSKFFSLMASTTFFIIVSKFSLQPSGCRARLMEGGRAGGGASPFSLLSLAGKWHLFSVIGFSYQDSTVFADCSLPL